MSKLNFKDWLFKYFAIDYDRWEPEMTDVTKKIWHEGYDRYLREWEVDKK